MDVTIVLIIDSGGLWAVYVGRNGQLALPTCQMDDPSVNALVTIARYTAGLGWDWSDARCLGPFSMALPDVYYQLTQDGTAGSAPPGYAVGWMIPREIQKALNHGSFECPALVDRAVSLYARAYGL